MKAVPPPQPEDAPCRGDRDPLYSSPNIIRVIKSKRMRWAGHVALMGKRGSAYKVLVSKSEKRRPPGRPRIIWEDNIKRDIQELGGGGTDWTDLVEDTTGREFNKIPDIF
jgi:hypothetical protein